MNLKAILFHYDNGWDGIAAVLGGLMVGAVLGLVGGIYSLKWIPEEKLKLSILIVLILNVLMIGVVFVRAEMRKVKSMRLERIAVHAPKYLGIYSIHFENNKVIPFYSVNYKDDQQTFRKIDSFAINENSMDLAYAPPYFMPYYSKTDYQVLQFNVKSLHHNYAEVVVNKINGQTSFLSLDDGKFENWTSYLLSGNSIDLISDDVTLYHRPLTYADPQKMLDDDLLKVLSVQEDWIQVKGSSGKIAWLKWYNEDGEVTVRVNYFE
ncbi:hypothetical protein GCM10007940_04890 [Portibacter lacus]|uniref:Uncharacterized protein n=2 Tax=Portibacter lacus TaxID=1099794 RepID=A0AA37SLQ9_9BACT|nr:hypothetical protein GCM10007940_04890 [Portibacter lacus]